MYYVFKKERSDLPVWLDFILFELPKITCLLGNWLFNSSWIYSIYFFSDVSNVNKKEIEDEILKDLNESELLDHEE